MDLPPFDTIATALEGRAPAAPHEVYAATMLCLRMTERGAEVLLCRRAERAGDRWSGQISLPGGRVDPDDATLLATAVRETREEVGIDPIAAGRLLGALPVLPGFAGSVFVQAFACEIAGDPPLVVSDEHRAAWWAPVAALDRRSIAVPEVDRPVIAYTTVGADGLDAVVWGLTFRILETVSGLSH